MCQLLRLPVSLLLNRESAAVYFLLPLGVTTVSHLPPSHPILSILISHYNNLHVLLYYIHPLFLLPGSSWQQNHYFIAVGGI